MNPEGENPDAEGNQGEEAPEEPETVEIEDLDVPQAGFDGDDLGLTDSQPFDMDPSAVAARNAAIALAVVALLVFGYIRWRGRKERNEK